MLILTVNILCDVYTNTDTLQTTYNLQSVTVTNHTHGKVIVTWITGEYYTTLFYRFY